MLIKSLKKFNSGPVALFTDQPQRDEVESLVDIYAQIQPRHINCQEIAFPTPTFGHRASSRVGGGAGGGRGEKASLRLTRPENCPAVEHLLLFSTDQ